MSARALFFDLDDTLYGYGPCNEVGLLAAHRGLLGQCQASFEQFMVAHDRARLELAAELKGQAASHNRAIFFKRVVERLVGPGNGGLAVDLFDGYWQSFLSAMGPAPGARKVLEELKGQHSLALVSNHTTDIQLRKLRALELESYFPVVMTSEEAGVEKPDPRIFELALKATGVEASQAIMIGDNPRVDGAGALAAGLQAVLTEEFSGSGESRDGELPVISSLGELPAWLATHVD